MNTPSDQPQMTYPKEWSEHISALAGSVELVVAGYATSVRLTAEELAVVYFPLLHELDRQQQSRNSRIVVGLAGIPGSGKSTFAAMLKHVADRVLGDDRVAVVGMDGWHWLNPVLDARTTRDEAGNEISLRQRKGGPESFDVDTLIRCLRALRDAKGNVRLPGYDRKLHEPVPDALSIIAAVRIVLIEGNYLLNRTPPWDCVRELLAPKLLLTCDAGVARERTIDRHIRGGMSAKAAAEKYEMNDRPNADIILRDESNTDLVISFDLEPRLIRNTDETG